MIILNPLDLPVPCLPWLPVWGLEASWWGKARKASTYPTIHDYPGLSRTIHVSDLPQGQTGFSRSEYLFTSLASFFTASNVFVKVFWHVHLEFSRGGPRTCRQGCLERVLAKWYVPTPTKPCLAAPIARIVLLGSIWGDQTWCQTSCKIVFLRAFLWTSARPHDYQWLETSCQCFWGALRHGGKHSGPQCATYWAMSYRYQYQLGPSM